MAACIVIVDVLPSISGYSGSAMGAFISGISILSYLLDVWLSPLQAASDKTSDKNTGYKMIFFNFFNFFNDNFLFFPNLFVLLGCIDTAYWAASTNFFMALATLDSSFSVVDAKELSILK